MQVLCLYRDPAGDPRAPNLVAAGRFRQCRAAWTGSRAPRMWTSRGVKLRLPDFSMRPQMPMPRADLMKLIICVRKLQMEIVSIRHLRWQVRSHPLYRYLWVLALSAPGMTQHVIRNLKSLSQR